MAKHKPQKKSTKHFQIEKTKRNVFLMVALAGVVVSITLVLGKFIFDWSAFNTRVLSAQSESIGNLEENIENAQGIVNEYRAFEGTSQDISAKDILDALPAEYDFTAWNSSLQFIVGLNSLKIESLSGDDLSLEAEVKSIEPTPISFDFSLGAQGRYGDIEAFVIDLKRSIRPIQLKRMVLSGSESSLSIEVSGQTYYQPAQSLDYGKQEIK